MKRTWIGAGFIALILALGFRTEYRLKKIQMNLGENLAMTVSAAESGSWENARNRLAGIANQWEKSRNFVETVSGSGTVLEIDGEIAELGVLGKQEEMTDFLAECGRLSSRLRGTAEFYAWLPGDF